jgi:hypothetical protein
VNPLSEGATQLQLRGTVRYAGPFPVTDQRSRGITAEAAAGNDVTYRSCKTDQQFDDYP